MVFQSNNNYKATSEQDKHLQKEQHRIYSTDQFFCYVSPTVDTVAPQENLQSCKNQPVSVCGCGGGRC